MPDENTDANVILDRKNTKLRCDVRLQCLHLFFLNNFLGFNISRILHQPKKNKYCILIYEINSGIVLYIIIHCQIYF